MLTLALDVDGVLLDLDRGGRGPWTTAPHHATQHVRATPIGIAVALSLKSDGDVQVALRASAGQPRFRSVISPPLASTNLWGSMPKTSCHVPAAAHTSGHCNRSGSMNTRKCVA
jgi:hypothetical protein